MPKSQIEAKIREVAVKEKRQGQTVRLLLIIQFVNSTEPFLYIETIMAFKKVNSPISFATPPFLFLFLL